MFRLIGQQSPLQWCTRHSIKLVATLWFAFLCAAQDPTGTPVEPKQGISSETSQITNQQPEAEEVESDDRTRLNLLGEVDSESGETRRNENVRLTLIDNNVLKELLQRMGTSATIIKQFNAEKSYFGLEFGGNPKAGMHLPGIAVRGIHGELFWTHQNSIGAARSFFQVGKVQPSRTNDYGLKFGSRLFKNSALSLQMSQRKLRGQVNGNVLVPAADERVPTTTDPHKRALVEQILGAYPDELPNRTDINARALNTNAPQSIKNDRVSTTLDNSLGLSRLSLRYNVTLQQVEAFQLVGGQNPDTTTKNHQSQLTWNRTWSPRTVTEFSLGYERVGSLLVPDDTSLGTFYLFSRILQSLGPSGNIPIDRAQNLFRYGARIKKDFGNHSLVAGAEVLRKQVNGSESNDHRGLFSFRSDFGSDTVGNLLAGTPSQHSLAIGNTHRGFRNWHLLGYIGDDWKVSPRLTLQLGLRFEPVMRPKEVNSLTEIPYGNDLNNLAPSVGVAYRTGQKSGVLRAAYTVQYGQIFNATFMQARFNQPEVLTIIVNAPDLLDPLKDFSAADLDTSARSNLYKLNPGLKTPYSHQYNFSWSFELAKDLIIELGYVGSRSHRLLNQRYSNRAQPVQGVEQITRTINERRSDPRYFNVLEVLNGSIGYYDAAKVTLRVPSRSGISLDVSYWLSKAIDLGSNYTNTASGRDGRNGRSPYELNVWDYMKGLSDFHQSHALMSRLSYAVPRLHNANPVLGNILANWQISSVLLLKTGTPFGIRSGSDSPGIGNVDGAGSDRPDLLDPSILGKAIDHPDTSRQMLPLQAFAFIAPNSHGGNLGRNTFRKDGVWNVNMALSRRFLLPKKNSLLFRLESLNVLNHPQFAEPDLNTRSRTFAAITNTLNDGRAFKATLQFAF